MKRIIVSLIIVIICIFGGLSAYAATQASGNENTPTVLALNSYYDSYINTAHPADYYTFTLNSTKKILIECDNVPKAKEYKMTLSGNGIEPIYTSDATDGYSMYITANLNAGTYNLKVEGEYRTRALVTDVSYHIAVFDELNRGHVVNDADSVIIDDNFENENMSKWLDGFRPSTERGDKTIETEANGNKYISFTAKDSSQYYVFEAKDAYSNMVLCSEFDIKFPSGNMDIQMRQADSNLDVNFKMAGRIRKISKRIQYYSNGQWIDMVDSTNNWLQINPAKWYTMRITLDVRMNKYNIYLEDRDSGTIISTVEEADFGQSCSHISYYAFSSTEKVSLDNVKMFESVIGENIDGYTYIKVPKEGTRQYRYFNTLSTSSKSWSAEQWTLLTSKSGVSIDKDTGLLSISKNAKPGAVIISAARKYYPWIKTTYLVDIDR